MSSVRRQFVNQQLDKVRPAKTLAKKALVGRHANKFDSFFCLRSEDKDNSNKEINHSFFLNFIFCISNGLNFFSIQNLMLAYQTLHVNLLCKQNILLPVL